MRSLLFPFIGAALLASASAAAAADPEQPATAAAAAPEAALAPEAATDALDPASLALAREILEVAYPQEQRAGMYAARIDSLFSQIQTAAASQKLTSDPDLDAAVQRQTRRMFDRLEIILNQHIPDIFESMAKAYARNFSPDELNQLLAFAKTPVGSHFFQRTAAIQQDPDFRAALQRLTVDMMGQLPEMTKEMAKDADDYAAQKAKQHAGKTPVS